MKQPNIILIMTDQLRGDCLGYAGHPDVKTPYLDSLASKGVVFDKAYSACQVVLLHGRIAYRYGTISSRSCGI